MTIMEYMPPTWHNRRTHRRMLRRMTRDIDPAPLWPSVMVTLAVLAICIGLLLSIPAMCCAEEAMQPAPGTIMTVCVNPDSGLNIRVEPTTEAGKRGMLANGAKVEVLETTDDGWAYVRWPGRDDCPALGWVCMEYLTETK